MQRTRYLVLMFLFAGFFLAARRGFAEVTNLRLARSGDDVVLTWTWTTAPSPFRVLGSKTALFMSGNRNVAEELATSPATDIRALVSPDPCFYQVLGSDEVDPHLYELNPPRPIPTITKLTPSGGHAGTVVLIEGANFPDGGSGMVVMFGTSAGDVESESVTKTQVVVTAPTDIDADDVVVCVVDVCSNEVQFTSSDKLTVRDEP